MKKEILILGDFNAPGINWQNRSVNHSNFYIEQRGLKLLELASILDCEQHNRSYDETNKAKVLDIALTNIQDVYLDSKTEALVKQDIYHPPFVITINNCAPKATKMLLDKPLYNFSQSNFLNILAIRAAPQQ